MRACVMSQVVEFMFIHIFQSVSSAQVGGRASWAGEDATWIPILTPCWRHQDVTAQGFPSIIKLSVPC